MDRGFLTTSRSRLVPRVITVILPPLASFIRSAASTALPSKGLITGGTPGGGTTLFEAGSILKLAGGASGSSTCLAQTIIFMLFPPKVLKGFFSRQPCTIYHKALIDVKVS